MPTRNAKRQSKQDEDDSTEEAPAKKSSTGVTKPASGATGITRKKSAFNRITDMIAKSPILEPLRSENKFYVFILFNLNPFFCFTFPMSMMIYFIGIKFFSFVKKSKNHEDRPTRQASKIKASGSNASDFGDSVPGTKVVKSKSILSSLKPKNIVESVTKAAQVTLISLISFFWKLKMFFFFNFAIIF